ncbi:Uncharacterised protein [uncultured archaeon]|nr:Uncharacterised protein [uncultured archaeon]
MRRNADSGVTLTIAVFIVLLWGTSYVSAANCTINAGGACFGRPAAKCIPVGTLKGCNEYTYANDPSADAACVDILKASTAGVKEAICCCGRECSTNPGGACIDDTGMGCTSGGGVCQMGFYNSPVGDDWCKNYKNDKVSVCCCKLPYDTCNTPPNNPKEMSSVSQPPLYACNGPRQYVLQASGKYSIEAPDAVQSTWWEYVNISRFGDLLRDGAVPYAIPVKPIETTSAQQNAANYACLLKFVRVWNNGSIECGDIVTNPGVLDYKWQNCLVSTNPINDPPYTGLDTITSNPERVVDHVEPWRAKLDKFTQLWPVDRVYKIPISSTTTTTTTPVGPAPGGSTTTTVPAGIKFAKHFGNVTVISGVYSVIGINDAGYVNTRKSIADQRRGYENQPPGSTIDPSRAEQGNEQGDSPETIDKDYHVDFVLARGCDVVGTEEINRHCKNEPLQDIKDNWTYTQNIGWGTNFSSCRWKIYDGGKFYDYPGVYIVVFNKSRFGGDRGLSFYTVYESQLNDVNHITEDDVKSALAWNMQAGARILGCDTCPRGSSTCSMGSSLRWYWYFMNSIAMDPVKSKKVSEYDPRVFLNSTPFDYGAFYLKQPVNVRCGEFGLTEHWKIPLYPTRLYNSRYFYLDTRWNYEHEWDMDAWGIGAPLPGPLNQTYWRNAPYNVMLKATDFFHTADYFGFYDADDEDQDLWNWLEKPYDDRPWWVKTISGVTQWILNLFVDKYTECPGSAPRRGECFDDMSFDYESLIPDKATDPNNPTASDIRTSLRSIRTILSGTLIRETEGKSAGLWKDNAHVYVFPCPEGTTRECYRWWDHWVDTPPPGHMAHDCVDWRLHSPTTGGWSQYPLCPPGGTIAKLVSRTYYFDYGKSMGLVGPGTFLGYDGPPYDTAYWSYPLNRSSYPMDWYKYDEPNPYNYSDYPLTGFDCNEDYADSFNVCNPPGPGWYYCNVFPNEIGGIQGMCPPTTTTTTTTTTIWPQCFDVHTPTSVTIKDQPKYRFHQDSDQVCDRYWVLTEDTNEKNLWDFIIGQLANIFGKPIERTAQDCTRPGYSSLFKWLPYNYNGGWFAGPSNPINETVRGFRDHMYRPTSSQHSPCEIKCRNHNDNLTDWIPQLEPNPSNPASFIAPLIDLKYPEPYSRECEATCFTYDFRYFRQFNINTVWDHVFKITPEVHTENPPLLCYPDTEPESQGTYAWIAPDGTFIEVPIYTYGVNGGDCFGGFWGYGNSLCNDGLKCSLSKDLWWGIGLNLADHCCPDIPGVEWDMTDKCCRRGGVPTQIVGTCGFCQARLSTSSGDPRFKCGLGEGDCANNKECGADIDGTPLECTDNPFVLGFDIWCIDPRLNNWWLPAWIQILTATGSDDACCRPGQIWNGKECLPQQNYKVRTRTSGNNAALHETGGGTIYFHIGAGANVPNNIEARGVAAYTNWSGWGVWAPDENGQIQWASYGHLGGLSPWPYITKYADYVSKVQPATFKSSAYDWDAGKYYGFADSLLEVKLNAISNVDRCVNPYLGLSHGIWTEYRSFDASYSSNFNARIDKGRGIVPLAPGVVITDKPLTGGGPMVTYKSKEYCVDPIPVDYDCDSSGLRCRPKNTPNWDRCKCYATWAKQDNTLRYWKSNEACSIGSDCYCYRDLDSCIPYRPYARPDIPDIMKPWGGGGAGYSGWDKAGYDKWPDPNGALHDHGVDLPVDVVDYFGSFETKGPVGVLKFSKGGLLPNTCGEVCRKDPYPWRVGPYWIKSRIELTVFESSSMSGDDYEKKSDSVVAFGSQSWFNDVGVLNLGDKNDPAVKDVRDSINNPAAAWNQFLPEPAYPWTIANYFTLPYNLDPKTVRFYAQAVYEVNSTLERDVYAHACIWFGYNVLEAIIPFAWKDGGGPGGDKWVCGGEGGTYRTDAPKYSENPLYNASGSKNNQPWRGRWWGCWEHAGCVYQVSDNSNPDCKNNPGMKCPDIINDSSQVVTYYNKEDPKNGEPHVRTEPSWGEQTNNKVMNIWGFIDYYDAYVPASLYKANVYLAIGAYTLEDKDSLGQIVPMSVVNGIRFRIPNAVTLECNIRSYPVVHELQGLESTKAQEKVIITNETERMLELLPCFTDPLNNGADFFNNFTWETQVCQNPPLFVVTHRPDDNDTFYYYEQINPLKKFYYFRDKYLGSSTRYSRNFDISAYYNPATAPPSTGWDFCRSTIDPNDIIKRITNYHEDERYYYDLVGIQAEKKDTSNQYKSSTGSSTSAINCDTTRIKQNKEIPSESATPHLDVPLKCDTTINYHDSGEPAPKSMCGQDGKPVKDGGEWKCAYKNVMEDVITEGLCEQYPDTGTQPVPAGNDPHGWGVMEFDCNSPPGPYKDHCAIPVGAKYGQGEYFSYKYNPIKLFYRWNTVDHWCEVQAYVNGVLTPITQSHISLITGLPSGTDSLQKPIQCVPLVVPNGAPIFSFETTDIHSDLMKQTSMTVFTHLRSITIKPFEGGRCADGVFYDIGDTHVAIAARHPTITQIIQDPATINYDTIKFSVTVTDQCAGPVTNGMVKLTFGPPYDDYSAMYASVPVGSLAHSVNIENRGQNLAVTAEYLGYWTGNPTTTYNYQPSSTQGLVEGKKFTVVSFVAQSAFMIVLTIAALLSYRLFQSNRDDFYEAWEEFLGKK